jgi:VanZ family protein
VERVPDAYRFRWIDRVGHCAEYGLLGWLATRALAANGVERARRLWLGVAVASLYGMTDELHQAMVPGRSCQLGDWVADTVGGALGSWLHSAGVTRSETVGCRL